MKSKIELNLEVRNGRPVVRGTRITIDTILGYLGAGDSVEGVPMSRPRLLKEDVLACIEYARRLSSARSTIQLAS